ncbi:unnamed protein product [Ambrosiozyma monospora]|uniref:Unnamed protein product n=1 Tax=Ambrosiozyma monospora TaxID=43982 RepID=A0ACB5SVG0_AMBMO|nr:unnamed protein product [Ambrosiozyma monospora]
MLSPPSSPTTNVEFNTNLATHSIEDTYQNQVITFEWNRNGDKIALAKSTSVIVIQKFDHKTRSFEKFQILIVGPHPKPTGCLAWDPSHDNKILSIARSNEIKFWEIYPSSIHTTKLKSVMLEHFVSSNINDCFNNVKFNKSGDFLAATTTSDEVFILKKSNFKLVHKFKASHRIYDFDWNSNGDYIVLAVESGELQFYNLMNLKANDPINEPASAVLKHSLKLSSSRITSVLFTADERYIISGANDSTVHIIDPVSLTIIKTIKASIDEPVATIDYIEDQKSQNRFLSVTYEYDAGCYIYNLNKLLTPKKR